jgi:cation:H+ antiporter
MPALSLPLLVGVFLAAALATWLAGTRLTTATDVLSTRLGLGEALGGMILLAIATNLPEIAITVSAALQHNLVLAVGNILGGIALQTVVLVYLDVFGLKQVAALTYRAASLVIVLEGLLVVAVLTLVMVGHQLSSALLFGWLPPVETIIAIVWIAGIYLVGRARKGLPWHERGFAPPDGQREPLGHARVKKHESYKKRGISTGGVAMRFVVGAVVTLIAGVVLELTSSAIATRVGMSGLIFGATVLAAATALPEVATGMEAIRLHDYQMAFSDILGGNAFLPVLFLPAVLLSGSNVLQVARKADMYLAGLGILLTVVYVGGLIFRPRRQILRMGIDSLCVLLVYLLGAVGLFFVSTG